ncbi:restriction endonuclease subunit S [Burkholderia gladioli]|uniref:restriction endonuclease subunit S n=1 Tax=Burkholderia gladioli TaxID=28095 RepID=UPI000F53D9BA|nr:restriction endonuclease subunit S [Burkholderia gladioli]
MSGLPRGWESVTIGDISTTAEQVVPNADDQFQYIDIGSVDRERKCIVAPQILTGAEAPSRARKLVQSGDTLVSMTRPNLNAVALVPEEFDGQIASTGFDVVRPLHIDPRWIFYAVRSRAFVEAMNSLVQGALYPAVKSKDVRSFTLAIAPLAEQKRIADKLDTVLARVNACRERLDRVEEIIKRFRQSVLSAATSGSLTAQWRADNQRADDWSRVELASVADDFAYGSSAKSSKSGKVPVLRMGNIQEGRLDWSDLVYTSDPVEIAKYRLSPGDVLFNRTNSPELVGKTAVFQGEQDAIYAGYLIRVRCSERLLPDYLNYCLNSPAGRGYCWQVKSDGVSQSNINGKKLAAFGFLLPTLEEQQEIVRCVRTLFAYADSLESRCKSANRLVEDLTPALLAKAFRGELVPQDPNDEPAAELLQRLARQLSGEGKATKRTRAKRATSIALSEEEPTSVE